MKERISKDQPKNKVSLSTFWATVGSSSEWAQQKPKQNCPNKAQKRIWFNSSSSWGKNKRMAGTSPPQTQGGGWGHLSFETMKGQGYVLLRPKEKDKDISSLDLRKRMRMSPPPIQGRRHAYILLQSKEEEEDNVLE